MKRKRSSLSEIAVLRGGNINFKNSLKEGAEVLTSLSRLGYTPLDVLIDKEGVWTLGGMSTDAHAIYTRAHTIIDTTHMKKGAYQILARKLGTPIMFSNSIEHVYNREDMYRILRLQDINVPNTFTIRASEPLHGEIFRYIWTTYHTPILVRPLEKEKEIGSTLATSFRELEIAIRQYHGLGIDVHTMTYRKAPTTSVAVLPNFRGEALYVPLWIESFAKNGGIPTAEAVMKVYRQAPEYRKEQLRDIVYRVYDALNIDGPTCIDLILHNDDFIVVNIDTTPSLRKDGRFMQSLSSTGVDIGQYIHMTIDEEFKR